MIITREGSPEMLFADTESFWKAPNVFDVAGLLGLIVGFFSVWLALSIARKDLNKRIKEAAEEAAKRASAAARDEVRRVARALLQSGVEATVRSLELAREVCKGKLWQRGIELCQRAREQLARVLAHPAADESIQTVLRDVNAALLDCVTRLRTKRTQGAGDAPDGVFNALDEAIVALHRVEGKMTSIQPEGDHG